jgi:hypothetical protein
LDNPNIAEPGTSGGDSIVETLTNTGATATVATYQFTLTIGSCSNTQEIRVIVNPLPDLSSIHNSAPICSGDTFVYRGLSAVDNTAFSWIRIADSRILPVASAQPQPSPLIREALVNTTAAPVTVYYQFETTANTCSHIDTLSVVVNPTPRLSSTLTPGDICSGSNFLYQIESQTATCHFAWQRLINDSIMELPSLGTSMIIGEHLTNLHQVATTAKYLVITEANNCIYNGDTVEVVVNNLPAISMAVPTPVNMMVGNTEDVQANIPAGATTVWTIADTTIATIAAGVSLDLATITAKAEGITYATITVTDPTTGCDNSLTFAVNVNTQAAARLTSAESYPTEICSGGTAILQLTLSGGVAPFAFTYTDGTNTYNDTALTGTYRFNVMPAANTTNAQQTVVYKLTDVTDVHAQSIILMSDSVVITVNPVATVSNAAALSQTVCAGSLVVLDTFATNVIPATAVTYQWVNNHVNIGLGLSGTGNIPQFIASNERDTVQTATIRVTPIFTGQVSCLGTASDITLIVEPKPNFTVFNPAPICAGDTFDLAANRDLLIQGLPVTTTVQFFYDLNCTQEVFTAVTPATTTSYWVKATAVGTAQCTSDVKMLTLTVNPIPDMDSILNRTVCNGEALTVFFSSNQFGTLYHWVKATPVNTDIIGLIDSGNVILSAIELINNTDMVQTQEIIVTPALTRSVNGLATTCEGNAKHFMITVNPTPVLDSALVMQPVCSGEQISYDATTSTPNTVVVWERENNSAILEEPTTGRDSIRETLTNLSQHITTVRYKVTLTLGNCSNIQYVTVTVNPAAQLSSPREVSVCSGNHLVYSATSAVTGATFTWERMPNADISEAATTGNSNYINEILTNTQNVLTTVKYAFTITANNCVISDTLTVIVGPAMDLTGTLTPDSICSGDFFIYHAATTDSSNIAITWYRRFNQNINPFEASGSGDYIAERLINTSNTAQTVSYQITLTGLGGCSVTRNVTTVVNPLPEVAVSELAVIIADSATRTITITDANAAAGTITISDSSIIDAVYNAGSIDITAKAVGYCEITYTATTDEGCENRIVIPVTVTPSPIARISVSGNNVICSQGTVNMMLNEIYYGKAPWTVELNYEGSTEPNTVITVTNLYDLPIVQSMTVPANTGNTIMTLVYRVVRVEDSEGSHRSNHPDRIVVQVLPELSLTTVEDMVFCAGTPVSSYQFTSALSDVIFTWQRIDGDTIASLPASGVNALPAFTAVNIGNTPRIAIYKVEASYAGLGAGCATVADTFNITVNHIPAIEPIMDKEYCAMSLTDAITFTGTANTIYDWRQIAGTNIGLTPNFGSGTLLSPFTTVNNNSYVRTATIEVTPRIVNTACVGNITTFSIYVNPIAVLSSQIYTDTLCSGEWFNYTATSATSNVLYRWTRPAVAGISNPAANNQGVNIHERLYNTSDTAVTVAYHISLFYEGCEHVDTIYVPVKPTPALILTSATYSVCQGEPSVDITFTQTPATLATNYMIIFDNHAQNNGFITMLNYQPISTAGVITVNIPAGIPAGNYYGTIMLEAGGCVSAEGYLFCIAVGQATRITQQPIGEIVICENSGSLHLGVTAIGGNLTYQWYHDGVAISGATDSVYDVQSATAADYGDYFVVVTGSCGTDTSNTINVVPNAAVIYLMGDDMLFVSGLDTNGTNLQFATYQWYKLNENTGKFLPISDGANAQYYYDENGIEGTYMVEITYINGSSFISCPYSFAPAPPAKLLQLYPNPVVHGNMFHILLGDDVKAEDWSRMTIEVMTTKGQVMQKIVPTAQVIDIRMTLPASVYVIRLTKANGEVSIHKLIVN